MSPREKKFVNLALNQIADAIEDDINGERIMKEVWEACEDDEDIAAVEAVMRQVVKSVRAMRVK